MTSSGLGHQSVLGTRSIVFIRTVASVALDSANQCLLCTAWLTTHLYGSIPSIQRTACSRTKHKLFCLDKIKHHNNNNMTVLLVCFIAPLSMLNYYIAHRQHYTTRPWDLESRLINRDVLFTRTTSTSFFIATPAQGLRSAHVNSFYL